MIENLYSDIAGKLGNIESLEKSSCEFIAKTIEAINKLEINPPEGKDIKQCRLNILSTVGMLVFDMIMRIVAFQSNLDVRAMTKDLFNKITEDLQEEKK